MFEPASLSYRGVGLFSTEGKRPAYRSEADPRRMHDAYCPMADVRGE